MDLNKWYIKYPTAAICSILAVTGAKKAVNTLDDYVSTHENQGQVWQASAEYLDEIKGSLDNRVYAGGMNEIKEAKDRCSTETGQDNCIYVDDYYDVAEPVNNPEMPEGLRKHPYGAISGKGPETDIETRVNKEPTNFENEKFNKLLFNDYREFIHQTLKNHGFDPYKLDNLVKEHRDNDVNFYHDGYMLLYDNPKREVYILHMGKQCIKDLM